MSSNDIFPGYAIVIFILTIGAVQDWQHGEVSNWISIPLFIMGVLASILRVLFLDDMLASALSLFAITVITAAAFKGWMGGADWKVLIALLGYGRWQDSRRWSLRVYGAVWSFYSQEIAMRVFPV